VREQHAHLMIDQRNVVGARRGAHARHRRHRRAEVGYIRADVRQGADAQREETMLGVERERRFADIVAPVGFGKEHLGPIAAPAHRSAEAPRRE
jgi:hypothetical protein